MTRPPRPARPAYSAEARSGRTRRVEIATGVLKLLALCMVGLLAGGWMMGTFVVVPAQRELEATVYAAVEQANTSYGQRYLPVLSGSSVVLLLILLIVDRNQRSLQRGLLVTSLVLIAVTVLYTAIFMVPLNAEVDTWSTQAPPGRLAADPGRLERRASVSNPAGGARAAPSCRRCRTRETVASGAGLRWRSPKS
jgi:hypothetical protein